MPNDTLDEIEARWRHAFAPPDIRTLVEMVQARDRVVEAAIRARESMRLLIREHPDPGTAALAAEWELGHTLAALDTPPAQEPTE